MAEPIAAYNFDEASGDILDVTGNGHDFPLGAITRVSGESGHGSAVTNGGIVNGPAMFGQTTQRTLMMRVQLPGTLTAGWAFEWHLNSGDTGIWGLLGLTSAGGIGFRARNASGTTAPAFVAQPTDGAWHHYAGTFDGSAVRTYLDGSLVATSSTLSGGIATNADVIRMFDVSIGTAPLVDDVRVYSEALDATAIAALVSAPVTPPTPPASGGRLKYESAPGIWTPVPLKTETGGPLVVKTETTPGTWEALP